jgi:hypothetical protein
LSVFPRIEGIINDIDRDRGTYAHGIEQQVVIEVILALILTVFLLVLPVIQMMLNGRDISRHGIANPFYQVRILFTQEEDRQFKWFLHSDTTMAHAPVFL